MSCNETAYYLRSDEDAVDYLRDKPMGRCTWCGARVLDLSAQSGMYPSGHEASRLYGSRSCRWDMTDTELGNRARYQEEREAQALVNEQVNREVSRGKEPPC